MQSTAHLRSRTQMVLFHQLDIPLVSVMLVSKKSVSGFLLW